MLTAWRGAEWYSIMQHGEAARSARYVLFTRLNRAGDSRRRKPCGRHYAIDAVNSCQMNNL